jgi:hypothetical protein
LPSSIKGSARCQVRPEIRPLARKPVVIGFPEKALGIAVVSSGKRLFGWPAGTFAVQREKDVAVHGYFLARARLLVVWSVAPRCEGPPPGYFGPDDGGTCHDKDETALHLVRAEDQPLLAGCF